MKINKNIIVATAMTVLFAMPLMTLAFDAGTPPTPNQSLDISTIIDLVIGFVWPVVIIVVILLFTFAAFKFFTANGDPDAVATARQAFIWGIAGTVVIFLAWSIPFVIRNQLYPGQ